MKKHYILVWIELPPEGPMNATEMEKKKHWAALRPILEMQAKKNKDIEKLSENVWLIPRDSALPFVAVCMGGEPMPLLRVHTKFLQEDVETASESASGKASP